MTYSCSFLRTRLKGRRALAIVQRKVLGVENPVILLEMDNTEAMTQQESPRSGPVVEMEEEASPRLDLSVEDAAFSSAEQTETNMELEFETT
jgi:hypothetical protein